MRSDDNTFRAIVKEYERSLYFHIRRLVVSHDDAKDILQDTFIKAFRSLWTLRKESGLRPWLYRIATNSALDFLKKRAGLVSLEENFANAIADGSGSDTIQNAEIALHKALLKLPDKQRLVFCLRYFDEMPYDDIAKITGMSENTLKVNYHLAKEKIKSKI